MGDDKSDRVEMKTKTCPKCAEEILALAERCRHCGANVKGLTAVDAALGVFLGLVVVLGAVYAMARFGHLL